ncbi:MAG: hypothetical protein ACLR43_10370 [Faecalibacillus faecis]
MVEMLVEMAIYNVFLHGTSKPAKCKTWKIQTLMIKHQKGNDIGTIMNFMSKKMKNTQKSKITIANKQNRYA